MEKLQFPSLANAIKNRWREVSLGWSKVAVCHNGFIAWGWDCRTSECVGLAIASLCSNHYIAGFEPRLVLLSKALYHTCFICGQRCKFWSRRPKLTLSVISDVKLIIYIFLVEA